MSMKLVFFSEWKQQKNCMDTFASCFVWFQTGIRMVKLVLSFRIQSYKFLIPKGFSTKMEEFHKTSTSSHLWDLSSLLFCLEPKRVVSIKYIKSCQLNLWKVLLLYIRDFVFCWGFFCFVFSLFACVFCFIVLAFLINF